MSREVLYSDDFDLDVFNQSRWYETKRNAKLAGDYREAVKATIRLLSEFPLLGTRCRFPHRGLTGLRSTLVKRPFEQHLLFYFVIGERLVIHRVLNGARDLRERLLEPPEREED